MRFDWDHLKAEKNLKKHGVSFEVAITAFDDPFALITVDEKHSRTEKREWLLGESDSGVLVVIFTIRQPGNIYRLISAR
ncbi:MAG: BrnT family toxin, partial [Proteobacteria bacterium]|nr:BrnT family toxin [Pseudomonadota bacterium]